MIELPNGQILVETDGMFNIYNGKSFQQLPCNLLQVYSMPTFASYHHYTDAKGMIWIKDLYNLYIFDPVKRQFSYDVEQRLAGSGVKERLKNFFIDEQGAAWLFTVCGSLYMYDWEKPARNVLKLTKDEMDNGVAVADVLHTIGNEYMIIFNTCAVRYWDAKVRRFTGTNTGMSTGKVSEGHHVHSLRWNKNTLLISQTNIDGGLYRYDVNERSWKMLIKGSVTSLFKKKDGTLLVGSYYGYYTMDKTLGHCRLVDRYPTEGGKVVGNSVTCLLCDRQGQLWLGCINDGVLYEQPSRPVAANYRQKEEEAPVNYIRTLTSADNGCLLAGTSGGAFLFDTVTCGYRPVQAVGAAACINAHPDSEGNVWVATDRGLYRYREGRAELFDTGNTKGVVGNHFRFCVEIVKGRYLVCNTLNRLGIFDPSCHRFECLNKAFPQLNNYRTMVDAVRISSHNRFAVLTQNGCFIYDADKNAVGDFAAIKEMQRYSKKYNCLYIDRHQCFWVGTQNGLLSFDGKQVHRYSTADGLPNNCIQAVVEDRNGKIWVSTSGGVARITRMGRGELRISSFGLEDGMSESEYLERSAFATPDGRIWLGSTGGITGFNPDIFEGEKKRMPVYLVDFRVRDALMPSDDSEVKLCHKENSVTLRFSALNYVNPRHTVYRYRLVGIDHGWVFSNDGSGMGQAGYAYLPPGDYVFEVQASVGDGAWGPVFSKSICISPPWWLSWWAYLLYVLLSVCLIVSVISRYLRNRKMKMESEAEERVNRMFELRDAARHQFAKSVSIDPKKIAVGNQEEELLQRILRAIEKNMDNTGYSVETLASDIGMDRTTLYRKMQAMLGITPSDFMRSVRLKRAALLMTSQSIPVNRVASMVGFNTPRYFSRYFKKMFGMTPSEYAERHAISQHTPPDSR